MGFNAADCYPAQSLCLIFGWLCLGEGPSWRSRSLVGEGGGGGRRRRRRRRRGRDEQEDEDEDEEGFVLVGRGVGSRATVYMPACFLAWSSNCFLLAEKRFGNVALAFD
jgi:hypothetical protein